ncbi:DUF2513 domain-containing protein (plasmid) [Roseivivax marinus]|jgi:hypothetical protein|uniref:DUF2513 domain-containing protein n=1 Tax=Roseivivax marinus TaxID=1379903 RepID=UPI001F04AD11|nr:DUF2513 domain-containing protein [Roseivivax marinus]UMA67234.1 DUF2513 domain-containing protein [Roseivivax marinus]
MRRDPDLEREILLAIESYDGEAAPGYANLGDLGAARIQVNYQVRLLDEAGLIFAVDAETMGDRFAMLPIRLTMAGHEYLDTIRDEEVWRRTKEGARAVGSFSLATLGALARGLVREKIRKHTGVEVDL